MAEKLRPLPDFELGVMTDLEKWLIFSNLDRAFMSTLRLACVFGSSGNEALVVTHDDDVYALGSNSNGCLGLGDTHGTLEPRKGRDMPVLLRECLQVIPATLHGISDRTT